MEKKKVVLALGHKALGTTLPEQMTAVKGAAKAVADLWKRAASWRSATATPLR